MPRWIQGDPERAGRRVRMDWMKGNAATDALDQSLCNASRVGLQCVCKCSPKIQYKLGARCVGLQSWIAVGLQKFSKYRTSWAQGASVPKNWIAEGLQMFGRLVRRLSLARC